MRGRPGNQVTPKSAPEGTGTPTAVCPRSPSSQPCRARGSRRPQAWGRDVLLTIGLVGSVPPVALGDPSEPPCSHLRMETQLVLPVVKRKTLPARRPSCSQVLLVSTQHRDPWGRGLQGIPIPQTSLGHRVFPLWLPEGQAGQLCDPMGPQRIRSPPLPMSLLLSLCTQSLCTQHPH